MHRTRRERLQNKQVQCPLQQIGRWRHAFPRRSTTGLRALLSNVKATVIQRLVPAEALKGRPVGALSPMHSLTGAIGKPKPLQIRVMSGSRDLALIMIATDENHVHEELLSRFCRTPL